MYTFTSGIFIYWTIITECIDIHPEDSYNICSDVKPDDFLLFRSHKHFIGRKWLIKDVEQAAKNAEHGLIIVAEPGFGKTAFISNIINGSFSDSTIRRNMIGYHFCQYSADPTESTTEFILDLIGRIKCKFNDVEYSLHCGNRNADCRRTCQKDITQCFAKYIVHPLEQMQKGNQTGTLYIIIDALDECDNRYLPMKGHISIVKILRENYKKISPILKFIMTSRNNSELLSDFDNLEKMQVDISDKRHLKDTFDLLKKKTKCDKTGAKHIVNHASANMLMLNKIISYNKVCDIDSNIVKYHGISDVYMMMFERVSGRAKVQI